MSDADDQAPAVASRRTGVSVVSRGVPRKCVSRRRGGDPHVRQAVIVAVCRPPVPLSYAAARVEDVAV